MFDNKNNSFNNLEPTNNQANPNISNQRGPSQDLGPSPIGELPQQTSNINNTSNIFNQSSQSLEPAPPPYPNSVPQQNPLSQPESITQSVLPPQPEPMEAPKPIEPPPPLSSTDNLMKTEPLSTTLPSLQPLNDSKPPEVVSHPNDFSFINELNYVKNVQSQEINPYKAQNNLSSTILEQNIIPKDKKIRLKDNSNLFQVVTITFVALILSAFIIAALVFNIHLLRISGTSMSPTITSKDWVLSTAQKEYTYGDIVAFYHNEVIMIKRIIALPGDTVLIDVGGNVYVNGELVEESYIETKALGNPEVEFPHTVHPESYFVLGDNREDSIDSRNISIRDIKSTDIVGKVSYSIIPFKKLK